MIDLFVGIFIGIIIMSILQRRRLLKEQSAKLDKLEAEYRPSGIPTGCQLLPDPPAGSGIETGKPRPAYSHNAHVQQWWDAKWGCEMKE